MLLRACQERRHLRCADVLGSNLLVPCQGTEPLNAVFHHLKKWLTARGTFITIKGKSLWLGKRKGTLLVLWCLGCLWLSVFSPCLHLAPRTSWIRQAHARGGRESLLHPWWIKWPIQTWIDDPTSMKWWHWQEIRKVWKSMAEGIRLTLTDEGTKAELGGDRRLTHGQERWPEPSCIEEVKQAPTKEPEMKSTQLWEVSSWE